MHLNIGQHMKLSQQMKLAPRMIHSMEILQLPLMALQERIEQEISENPLLENGVAEMDAGELELEPGPPPEAPPAKEVEQRELVVDTAHNNEADFERLLEMSADWPD